MLHFLFLAPYSTKCPGDQIINRTWCPDDAKTTGHRTCKKKICGCEHNTGNLSSAYNVAQSAEQYRLNTDIYIEVMNVTKEERNKRKYEYQQRWTILYRHRRLCIHTHTHTHICAHTNTIQTVGTKDSITQLKCSEKRNVLSLFFKEGRKVECLTSWVRLFQMWGLK